MGSGIAIVGLNGSGKSTLVHALAKEFGWTEMGVEDFYFPEQTTSRQAVLEDYGEVECHYLGKLPYSQAGSKAEVETVITDAISMHQKFILCGVSLNWNEEILSRIEKYFD